MPRRPADPRIVGLVLAAGAGSRFGGPKGLARTADGEPWVARAVRTLQHGGCGDVLVAVGAAAEEVAALVPASATVVLVEDWVEGMSASLRAGLEAAAIRRAEAVVLVTVDTPDLPSAAVRRVLAAAPDRESALVQAVYAGRPGHPVLIGADHSAAAGASLAGDHGARPYLAAHGVVEVECGDLWSGEDIDRR
jgi:CTP:molybdopterin cytidylyltransferase MocA